MAEESTATAAVLERCSIQPSPLAAAAEELTLPLIHFDMPFLFFHPIQRLLFFEFPCSRSQFLETIVPNLKQSLAQSLLHFLPLAGNIVSYVNSGRRPVSRFVPGDSVSLTIAESDKDFDLLTGNHPRLADDFYGCVAKLPPVERSEDEVVFAALALQITLFPGRGVCLAFTNDHGIGDASSIVRFIKLWASVNKLGGEAAAVVETKFMPSLDRSTVEDPDGLDSIYWNVVKNSRLPAIHSPINKFRSTFILSDAHIKKLKSSILKSRPQMHVTTFTVTCALAWVCLVKAEDAAAGSAPAQTDEPEFFVFPADCRSRLNPPLPEAYFGNCLALVRAELTHGTLTGPNGISSAAESLGAAIKRTVYNEKGILDGAETWPEEFAVLVGKRIFGVAGSPRFDLYEVDYGWGRAKKFESPSIDADTSMSLCKSRDLEEGGLEIGLSRRKEIVEAFAAEFAETLEKL